MKTTIPDQIADAQPDLCYGDFRIHPEYAGMEANLLGKPHG